MLTGRVDIEWECSPSHARQRTAKNCRPARALAGASVETSGSECRGKRSIYEGICLVLGAGRQTCEAPLVPETSCTNGEGRGEEAQNLGAELMSALDDRAGCTVRTGVDDAGCKTGSDEEEGCLLRECKEQLSL